MPESLVTVNFGTHYPQIADDPRLYLRVLAIYIAEHRQFRSRFSACCESMEMKPIRECIHAIKGSSGTLGMQRLYEVAEQYEQQVINGIALSDEQRETLITLVLDSIQDAEQIVAMNESYPGDDDPDEVFRAYPEIKEDLMRCLSNYEVIPDTLVHEYKSTAKCAVGLPIVKLVMSAIERFDYDTAHRILKEKG
ncbi:Hpt domain-containing protein [Parasalinivibrio latis]